MKTILTTAYAVNPYKGSEDGMGWNFIYQIARFQKVIAITRKNNRNAIEKYMQEHPSKNYQNIQFIYFDLPYWMRFWKRGGKGAMLYYWMWQRGIVSFIRQQKLKYDIVHNLNFHNDWTPSHLWKLQKPFVWGPIGHHPKISKEFIKDYPSKYIWKEKLTWTIKNYFWKYSRNLRKTIQHTDMVLGMNSEVASVLNLGDKNFQLMPSVACEDNAYQLNKSNEKFTVLSVGRLVPLKGFDLTIKAFAKFLMNLPNNQKENCELLIVGKGREKAFYEELCEREGVEKYVQFIDWLPRQELMKLYQDASIFLFPSHEGAGMVVAEALSFGLPVICLDNSGPGEFIDKDCGIAIQSKNYEDVVTKLGTSIHLLYQNPKKQKLMRLKACLRFEEKFHWDRRGESLNKIYQEL